MDEENEQNEKKKILFMLGSIHLTTVDIQKARENSLAIILES